MILLIMSILTTSQQISDGTAKILKKLLE